MAPPPPEHRDDLETLAPPSPAGSRTGFPFGSVTVPNNRCRVSSLCQSVDSRGADISNNAENKEKEAEVSSPLNDTRMDLEEERLDLNSVLSGTMDDDAKMMPEEGNNGVSVKNLSRIFEESDERRNAAAKPTRPPLAPARSNLKTEEDVKVNVNEDQRLSVYLRIRPPVSSTGKEGVDGSISTIEVLPEVSGSLSNTIRTYPPLTSNAAKVVRTGNNRLGGRKNTSKSLNDDGSSGDENGEVLGVKEYEYSGVFGPNSTQSDIYETIAAPLVEGLFPEEKTGELGESALLFTLGVTNAGKT